MSPTICKVPRCIRETDPSAYTPSIVSIGPHHRGSPQLAVMDLVKTSYSQRFIRRNNAFNESDYLKHLIDVNPHVQTCYPDDICMDGTEFLQLLLRDACFILELLLANKYRDKGTNYQEDPIFGNVLNLSLVKSDLLRLENQLPFFVLDSFFNLAMTNQSSVPSLVQLAINFFASLLPPLNHISLPDSTNFYHLLHLIHFCATGNNGILVNLQNQDKTTSMTTIMIPRAIDLQEAVGFEFRRKKDGSFWNVSFHQCEGVMEVSPVLLNNNSGSLYRNLIAFEQHCLPDVKTPVMAFVLLMGCLINSVQDWELLRQHGVVDSTLNIDKSSKLFRDMSNEAIEDYELLYSAILGDLTVQVLEYYQDTWRQRRIKIKRIVLHNLGTIASVIVGLFIVGGVQSIFSVLSYFKSQN